MISPLPIDIKLNHNETDDALMEPCQAEENAATR